MAAQALAGDEVAHQDGELGVARARHQRRARDRADQRFAGGQRLGGDQGELGVGVGMGQALRHFRRQLLQGVEEPVADLFRSQQAEGALDGAGIFRADRADQQFTPAGQAEVFMPRRQAFRRGHGAMLA